MLLCWHSQAVPTEPLPGLVLGTGSRAVSLHPAGSQLSSRSSAGAPTAVALGEGWRKGAGVLEEQLVGSCGSSAVGWKGAVRGDQSAQGCTLAP